MFELIVMTCVLLQCEDIKVDSLHPTMEACEAVMEEKFDDLEDGQAVMCIRKRTEELTA